MGRSGEKLGKGSWGRHTTILGKKNKKKGKKYLRLIGRNLTHSPAFARS